MKPKRSQGRPSNLEMEMRYQTRLLERIAYQTASTHLTEEQYLEWVVNAPVKAVSKNSLVEESEIRN